MKVSNYLGYKYKDQISILASRLTLHIGSEIKLYFFDLVHIHMKDEDEEQALQGATLSRYSLPLETAEILVKDLDCIYINKRDYKDNDPAFIVAPRPEIIQEWYNVMREGSISISMLYKFGEMFDKGTPEERESHRRELAKLHPILTP